MATTIEPQVVMQASTAASGSSQLTIIPGYEPSSSVDSSESYIYELNPVYLYPPPQTMFDGDFRLPKEVLAHPQQTLFDYAWVYGTTGLPAKEEEYHQSVCEIIENLGEKFEAEKAEVETEREAFPDPHPMFATEQEGTGKGDSPPKRSGSSFSITESPLLTHSSTLKLNHVPPRSPSPLDLSVLLTAVSAPSEAPHSRQTTPGSPKIPATPPIELPQISQRHYVDICYNGDPFTHWKSPSESLLRHTSCGPAPIGKQSIPGHLAGLKQPCSGPSAQEIVSTAFLHPAAKTRESLREALTPTVWDRHVAYPRQRAQSEGVYVGRKPDCFRAGSVPLAYESKPPFLLRNVNPLPSPNTNNFLIETNMLERVELKDVPRRVDPKKTDSRAPKQGIRRSKKQKEQEPATLLLLAETAVDESHTELDRSLKMQISPKTSMTTVASSIESRDEWDTSDKEIPLRKVVKRRRVQAEKMSKKTSKAISREVKEELVDAASPFAMSTAHIVNEISGSMGLDHADHITHRSVMSYEAYVAEAGKPQSRLPAVSALRATAQCADTDMIVPHKDTAGKRADGLEETNDHNIEQKRSSPPSSAHQTESKSAEEVSLPNNSGADHEAASDQHPLSSNAPKLAAEVASAMKPKAHDFSSLHLPPPPPERKCKLTGQNSTAEIFKKERKSKSAAKPTGTAVRDEAGGRSQIGGESVKHKAKRTRSDSVESVPDTPAHKKHVGRRVRQRPEGLPAASAKISRAPNGRAALGASEEGDSSDDELRLKDDDDELKKPRAISSRFNHWTPEEDNLLFELKRNGYTCTAVEFYEKTSKLLKARGFARTAGAVKFRCTHTISSRLKGLAEGEDDGSDADAEGETDYEL